MFVNQSYLLGVEVNRDHVGDSSRAKDPIAPRMTDPCDFPKMGNIERVISGSGDMRAR